ncbi:50S ribosomal protein L21e [Candidatus Micrarchaeota archaeon]|nr:50S ribosomal protein L21e [Candidatus Micrarchaeota archaeon]
MVKSSKGTLSGKTRMLKGKSRVSVNERVKTFEIGQKVVITPKAIEKGLPHLRYRNRHGRVVEKRGKGYLVEISDYGKTKKLVVGPVHLKLAS